MAMYPVLFDRLRIAAILLLSNDLKAAAVVKNDRKQLEKNCVFYTVRAIAM
jgi:hypothetical protein